MGILYYPVPEAFDRHPFYGLVATVLRGLSGVFGLVGRVRGVRDDGFGGVVGLGGGDSLRHEVLEVVQYC